MKSVAILALLGLITLTPSANCNTEPTETALLNMNVML